MLRSTLLAFAACAVAAPVRSAPPVTGPTPMSFDAAALDAARVAFPLPDGRVLRFDTVRRTGWGAGTTTWVGRDGQGASAVVTVGPGVVFGELPGPDGRVWRLAGDAGGVRLSPPAGAIQGNHDDAPAAPTLRRAGAKGGVASVVVDVVVGYTANLATRLGGVAQAEARVAHVISLANQALEDSDVPHRFRLVHRMQVNYGNTVSNDAALQALTGVSCNPGCIQVPAPAALEPLRAARETHGGDLVVLLRPYVMPEQGDCGRAWLLGGGGFAIDGTDAPYGFSVVSDGNDVNEADGRNYFCPATEMAHQLGHNAGQQHNLENSGGSSGTHPYSYGYRESSNTGFYTIMAERLANSSQFGIVHYANPAITYAATGRATGTASANNARSLTDSLPIVATFRAGALPPQVFANGFE